MTDGELIARLRSMHWCVTTEANGVGVYDSEVAPAAADRIEQFLMERDAIREDAIREAAAVAEALEIKWWKEYKDRLSPHCADPQHQGMSDGAGDVAAAILELIGEKK